MGDNSGTITPFARKFHIHPYIHPTVRYIYSPAAFSLPLTPPSPPSPAVRNGIPAPPSRLAGMQKHPRGLRSAQS